MSNLKRNIKIREFLKQKHFNIHPTDFIISDNSTTNLLSSIHKDVLFLLKENLQKFFELPDIFKMMEKNLEETKSNNKIINICSGTASKDT